MQDNGKIVVIGFLIGFMGLLVLARINIRLAIWSMAAFLLLAVLFYPIKLFLDGQREKQHAKTYVGSVEAKIRNARNQLSKHENEIQDIERNIGDLKTKLEISPDLKPQMIAETEKLIIAFRSELKLRHAKIGFYQTAIKKLQALLQNHQMIQVLANKQASLKKLQDNNYDDLAEIETTRSDMEYEKFYLESIESLSDRMLESDTLDLAQDLRLELEEITKELGEM